MSSLNMIINDARACMLKLDQVLYTHDDDDDDDDDVFFCFRISNHTYIPDSDLFALKVEFFI